ncbi:phosphoribosyltransferase domain-containing protein [Lachnotalea glycerini]|uniref:Orotate phosphoribosyltransferase n=1 Tax=Lachnotalea glycerini TaxID=1763509 RepID=A0A371JGK1_9FIRM|nr:phosphoribosyltransferase domain-containing protein [Lachnotalea glycerini]RDY31871.1 hypothetical protein CG710_007760 [Lachnotalea glycerini]
MYQETELIGIAKRENNKKRNYLVVNKLQGKHVPVEPKLALTMFQELAKQVKKDNEGKRLLLVGFAETATAIGAAVAAYLNCDYIQTTREHVEQVNYLFFSEAHSHAVEQKLIKEDMDVAIPLADRIIFIEDEVTTGNTIMNIIHEIEQKYRSRVSFAVASLLNGMDETALRKYQEYNISMYYLVKTDHSQYEKIADNYYGDGSYTSIMQDLTCHYTDELLCTNAVNARRLTQGEVMQEACVGLWNQINAKYVFDKVQSILVLGTEEFMYPALFVADKMERSGLRVKFHATTRSPITVSSEDSYPLHSRYELKSFYDEERVTYLYDLEQYDQIFVITDAARNNSESGENSLLMALKAKNNKTIHLIRWCLE